VVAVEVVLGEHPYEATLKNNGLFYELPDASCLMASAKSLG
jgi:hypothetical protein